MNDDVDSRLTNRPSVQTWRSWWILIVCLLGHVIYYGVAWTVGVYHVIFLEAFQQSASVTSWIASINTASLYFIAPIGGVMVGRFGCRSLAMVGTIIAAVGLFLSYYANSVYVLYFTFGFMTGGGMGVAYIPMITVLSRYFDRHRALALAVASSGNGIGLVVMPPLIQHLNHIYGWRGSLLIISAMLVQFIVMIAFMEPIHLPEDDVIDQLYEKPSDDTRTAHIVHHFKLSIFKEKRYVLLCLNNCLLMFSISVVFVHLIAYAVSMGVNETAWIFTALGASIYVGRMFYGLLGQWPTTDFVLVYGLALLIAGLPIVLLPQANNFVDIMAVTVVFGLGTSVIGPYLPQLNIIFLGLNRLPVAYGYLLIFEGIGTLLGAPSAGALFDYTGEYDYTFYVGGCSLILSALVMVPAWRWAEPLKTLQPTEECHQSGRLVKNSPSGRSSRSMTQSQVALAESLSRMASSRSQLSLTSLRVSNTSLSQSICSLKVPPSHGRSPELVPMVAFRCDDSADTDLYDIQSKRD